MRGKENGKSLLYIYKYFYYYYYSAYFLCNVLCSHALTIVIGVQIYTAKKTLVLTKSSQVLPCMSYVYQVRTWEQMSKINNLAKKK